MANRLEGRVALVTGGSRGIGRGIALTLARQGADIAVNYARADEAAAEVVAQIEKLGRKSIAIKADVSDSEQAHSMAAQALDALGRLDILVANAGTSSQRHTIADSPPEEWAQVFGVNFYGCLYPSQAVLPTMRDEGSGCIIHISSAVVKRLPTIGAPYAVSKAALEALTVIMSKEEARRGIRVNCVRPGVVGTDMVAGYVQEPKIKAMIDSLALGRIGTPEDIAGMVAYLCGDDAGWITGQIISVDGGGPLN